MNVFDTLKYTADRLQIPLAVGSFDVGGSIHLLYVNASCAVVFGYPSSVSMVGLPVESLMPTHIAKDHKQIVADYAVRVNGGTKRVGGVMDRWRDLDGVRRDGSSVPLSVNVADIRNNEERYFVAIFYDRTADIAAEQARNAERNKETEALLLAQKETQRALTEADKAREIAETARQNAEIMRSAAEEAKLQAEDGLLKQRRLAGQITLLRQIYAGTMMLVVVLAILVVAQWSTGGNGEGLSMVKDILLVMTGILGSAMASVFDSRNGKTGE